MYTYIYLRGTDMGRKRGWIVEFVQPCVIVTELLMLGCFVKAGLLLAGWISAEFLNLIHSSNVARARTRDRAEETTRMGNPVLRKYARVRRNAVFEKAERNSRPIR